MTTVGIRELKAKLSEFVDRAKRGEQIVVTEYGTKVAILAPLPAEHALLDSLVQEGFAEWNGGKPKGLEGIKAKGRPISDTVIEDR